MWIYGIKLILTESSPDSSRNMFDLDVLNSFISNTNQGKPDRAEMAKRVLESFATSDHSSAGDMSTYLQQFAAMNFGSRRFRENSKSSEVDKVNNTQISTECNGDSISQDPFDLKAYIDNKFTDLERRLIERIEVMDKNTNQKLDAILKKLELNSNNDK